MAKVQLRQRRAFSSSLTNCEDFHDAVINSHRLISLRCVSYQTSMRLKHLRWQPEKGFLLPLLRNFPFYRLEWQSNKQISALIARGMSQFFLRLRCEGFFLPKKNGLVKKNPLRISNFAIISTLIPLTRCCSPSENIMNKKRRKSHQRLRQKMFTSTVLFLLFSVWTCKSWENCIVRLGAELPDNSLKTWIRFYYKISIDERIVYVWIIFYKCAKITNKVT